MAKIQTLVVSEPIRQRAGALDFPSFKVPTIAAGELQIFADIDPVEYSDPSKGITCRVYKLNPDGLTWRFIAGSTWVGGDVVDDEGRSNPPPLLTALNSEDLIDETIRVEIVFDAPLKCGGRLEINSR